MTWNTIGLPDGNYTVRLTVQNTDGSSYMDSKVITVINNSGRIVFSSSRDGNDEIYIMNADGSNQTRLTNNSAQDDYPSLSPDGNKIVFRSTRDGDSEIYVMNADGTNPIRLTNSPGYDLGPVFSPDGTKIAFFSNRAGDYDIYVMNADGTNQTALTHYADNDSEPKWSPDGSKIVFSSTVLYGDRNIFVMNADGTNVTALTTNSAFDSRPAWSPDGKKIAFISNRGNSNFYNFDIYVMNSDGSNQTRITSSLSAEDRPTWSVDGSKIAYEYDLGGDYEIYVMNSDGSNPTMITNSAGTNMLPSWGPGYVADLTPPITTLSSNPSSPDGQNNYFKTIPSITLSRNESGTTYHSWNSSTGPWTTYSTPFNAPSGDNTLYYYSVDTAGNSETLKNQPFRVDTAAPSSTITNPIDGQRIHGTTYTITGTSSDSSSGIAKVEVSINGGAWQLATGTTSWSYVWTLPADGSYSITAKSTDNAGNLETYGSGVSVIVDTVSPTTTASPPGGTYYGARIVTLTANESATIYYTTDGSIPTTSSPIYSGLITISATTTLRFFAVDLAGNQESIKTEVYTIDTTPPNCSALSAASETWVGLTIESGGVGRYNSIATDSNKKVHISYYDETNRDLKYATNSSGSWVTTTIDSTGSVGGYTSIAIDSNNKAHISYLDWTPSVSI